MPLLPIQTRDGSAIRAGENALIGIVGRRARQAFGTAESQPAACAARVFADEDLLRRVEQCSGGHLRSLLVTMSQLLDWIDELPLDANTVDRYTTATARDFARALFPADRAVLRQVAADGQSSDDPRFFELLRNLYVFAYRGGDGDWYGVNPLLREIGSCASSSASRRPRTRPSLRRSSACCGAPTGSGHAFARAAPDQWSGRSGFYRFAPQSGDASSSARRTAAGLGWSASPAEREERERLLRDLLAELDDRDDDRSARADIRTSLGDAARMQDSYADAIEHYQHALPIHRDIGDRLGEAGALLGFGSALAARGSDAAAATLQDAARIYDLLGRPDWAAVARDRLASASEAAG